MTLAICFYASNHASVPLAAMLIKLIYEAVIYYWKIDTKDNKFTYQWYRSMQHEHI